MRGGSVRAARRAHGTSPRCEGCVAGKVKEARFCCFLQAHLTPDAGRRCFSFVSYVDCAPFERDVVQSDRCASLKAQLRARSIAASTHTLDAAPAVAAVPHEHSRTIHLTAPPLSRDLADRHRNAFIAMPSTDAAPAAEAVVEPIPVDPKSTEADGASAKAKDSKDAGAPIKEVPKPDQPRLPKPDRRDLDKAVEELQEACDVKQARIEELKRAIETRRDARKTVSAGSASTKTRIQELNQQFQAHMVRGSPSSIAHSFADRDDTFRRTPRPRVVSRDPDRFRGVASLRDSFF